MNENDIDMDKPYTQFLEKAVEKVFEMDPVSIAFVTLDREGSVLTAYFNCNYSVKGLLAHHIQGDAYLEQTLNNIGRIRDALESTE